MKKVAALFVQKKGCYSNLQNIDPYDLTRDARKYNGPFPVIAHPPCKRWGNYWFGSPSGTKRYKLGDDDGCFEAALAAVRKYGGILEHPAYSRAWDHFGILKPPSTGGWVVADWQGGWTCHVEQGHYGHRARKATWLYAIGVDLPYLRWGKSPAQAKLDAGFHSAEERAQAKNNGWERNSKEFLSHRERAATPIPFRDLLIQIAETAYDLRG